MKSFFAFCHTGGVICISEVIDVSPGNPDSSLCFIQLSIQKTNTMASGPITSWEVDGETVETVSDFIFLDCKITADGDCSPEIKRRLLLGRKVITNLDNILKSRDITLSTKVCQGYGFSSGHVWM